ncbi:hypothetical protein METHB2_600029 [Candidatus Methylobacter favarea]|uniref:Uncharacterized protein n=1 Tax=Candidatus Methylobacter favarea TaxID=2707345 RepID=A0A8S0X2V8_9GAMM|nr:hypothetical protein METHB2_600029 [Candidatus Methylobacter favarea]
MAEIFFSSSMSFLQSINEHLGLKQVITHGGKTMLRIARNRLGLRGFFLKINDSERTIRSDDAKVMTLIQWHRQGCHRHIGLMVQMKLNHLVNVHAIDMIGTKDCHYVGAVMFYQPQVLVDGVSSALEPFRATAHLGRHDSYEVVRNDIRNRPCPSYVLDQ